MWLLSFLPFVFLFLLSHVVILFLICSHLYIFVTCCSCSHMLSVLSLKSVSKLQVLKWDHNYKLWKSAMQASEWNGNHNGKFRIGATTSFQMLLNYKFSNGVVVANFKCNMGAIVRFQIRAATTCFSRGVATTSFSNEVVTTTLNGTTIATFTIESQLHVFRLASQLQVFNTVACLSRDRKSVV